MDDDQIDPIEIDHLDDFGGEYINSKYTSRCTQTCVFDELLYRQENKPLLYPPLQHSPKKIIPKSRKSGILLNLTT